jgi:hypothetical protein
MIVFLAWYDPDKRKSAAVKVAEAAERYVEKFGSAPALCLTSVADAGELEEETGGVMVRAVSFIGRNVFYVGAEEERNA